MHFYVLRWKNKEEISSREKKAKPMDGKVGEERICRKAPA